MNVCSHVLMTHSIPHLWYTFNFQHIPNQNSCFAEKTSYWHDVAALTELTWDINVIDSFQYMFCLFVFQQMLLQLNGWKDAQITWNHQYVWQDQPISIIIYHVRSTGNLGSPSHTTIRDKSQVYDLVLIMPFDQTILVFILSSSFTIKFASCH